MGQNGPKGDKKYDKQAVVRFLGRGNNRVENVEIGRKKIKKVVHTWTKRGLRYTKRGLRYVKRGQNGLKGG